MRNSADKFSVHLHTHGIPSSPGDFLSFRFYLPFLFHFISSAFYLFRVRAEVSHRPYCSHVSGHPGSVTTWSAATYPGRPLGAAHMSDETSARALPRG